MILGGCPQRDNTENRHSVTIVAPSLQAPALQQTIPFRVIMPPGITTTAETQEQHLIQLTYNNYRAELVRSTSLQEL